MKKLVWTALAAAASAAAAGIAVRGLRFAWERLMKEPAPGEPWWAKKLVGNRLGKNVRVETEFGHN